MGTQTEAALLGKHFLLLVKNDGLFIFVLHMGSYPVFSWVDLGQFPPPQGTCAPSADIWLSLPSVGAGRVSGETTAPSVGRPPSPRHAARRRPVSAGLRPVPARGSERGLGLFPALRGSPAARLLTGVDAVLPVLGRPGSGPRPCRRTAAVPL